MTALCRTCGGVMVEDFYGDGMHPTCDPESQRALRRMDQERRLALALGREGARRSIASNPKEAKAGVDIIRSIAINTPFISADDVRTTLEAAGIERHRNGGIYVSKGRAAS